MSGFTVVTLVVTSLNLEPLNETSLHSMWDSVHHNSHCDNRINDNVYACVCKFYTMVVFVVVGVCLFLDHSLVSMAVCFVLFCFLLSEDNGNVAFSSMHLSCPFTGSFEPENLCHGQDISWWHGQIFLIDVQQFSAHYSVVSNRCNLQQCHWIQTFIVC